MEEDILVVELSSARVIRGLTGEKGDKGDDGYTPVRGTDYWTAEDIETIHGWVESAILNGVW